MLERLKALALILERMNVLYERVLGILERERQALIILDYETLYAAMREKDEMLSAIRGLDKDRLRIQDQFATLNDVDPAAVTLKYIGEALLLMPGESEVIGRRLLAHRDMLGKTVGTLKEKLLRNRDFIHRSVDNLRGIAENLADNITGKPGAASRETNVYNGKARYQESNKHAGSILQKRL